MFKMIGAFASEGMQVPRQRAWAVNITVLVVFFIGPALVRSASARAPLVRVSTQRDMIRLGACSPGPSLRVRDSWRAACVPECRRVQSWACSCRLGGDAGLTGKFPDSESTPASQCDPSASGHGPGPVRVGRSPASGYDGFVFQVGRRGAARSGFPSGRAASVRAGLGGPPAFGRALAGRQRRAGPGSLPPLLAEQAARAPWQMAPGPHPDPFLGPSPGRFPARLRPARLRPARLRAISSSRSVAGPVLRPVSGRRPITVSLPARRGPGRVAAR